VLASTITSHGAHRLRSLPVTNARRFCWMVRVYSNALSPQQEQRSFLSSQPFPKAPSKWAPYQLRFSVNLAHPAWQDSDVSCRAKGPNI
jgi:hypothetical protein